MHFFYALSTVSVFAKLFFSLLLLIAIILTRPVKDGFFSTWLGYNLLGNFCISKKYISLLLIKCISVKHANDTDVKSLW